MKESQNVKLVSEEEPNVPATGQRNPSSCTRSMSELSGHGSLKRMRTATDTQIKPDQGHPLAAKAQQQRLQYRQKMFASAHPRKELLTHHCHSKSAQ